MAYEARATTVATSSTDGIAPIAPAMTCDRAKAAT